VPLRAETLSPGEARRIALAAQGFDRPRPRGRVDARHLRRVIRELGLLQIDFVNALVPAHYLVPFSRLGPYERTRLDALVYRSGDFTEQWAHEASILPVDAWPLLRHRMRDGRVRPRTRAFLERHPRYARFVLAQVRRHGPLGAEVLPAPDGMPRRLAGTWSRSLPRIALEGWFVRGVLAVADRRPNFARTYDLAERRIPEALRRRRVSRVEAQRELLLRAARACGVATAHDLADYWRMPMTEARPRLRELARSGALRPVRVRDWVEDAYLHPSARRPMRLRARALLAPFDPVVWHRPRTRRLFDFDYRLEIFLPASQRRFGYYVLPFLEGDRLAARVDLAAERKAGRLVARAAYAEPGADPERVAGALARELRELCRWLGLDEVRVGRRGDLAPALARVVRARA